MRRDALLINTSESPSIQYGIDEFMLHLRACRNSRATLEHYGASLKQFAIWCDDHGVAALDDLTPHVLRVWLDELRQQMGRHGKPFEPGTIRTHYNNVRVFINFLELEELITTAGNRTHVENFVMYFTTTLNGLTSLPRNIAGEAPPDGGSLNGTYQSIKFNVSTLTRNFPGVYFRMLLT